MLMSTSRGRQQLPMILALTFLLFSPSSLDATTWAVPIRPLSNDEKAELGISAAEVAGIGIVTAMDDSIIGGRAVSSMVVSPVLSIKGSLPLRQIKIYFPPFTNIGRSTVQSILKRGPGLIAYLLHNVDGKWVVMENPNFFHAGLVEVTTENRAEIESTLRRAVLNSLDASLATRADVVVVGTLSQGRDIITYYGVRTRYTHVNVDSVIIGGPVGSSMRVITLGGALDFGGPAVLFVKAVSDDLFEVVGFRRGARAIADNHLKTAGESLAEFANRIRLAAAGR